jgi:hypothetical protein
MSPLAPPAPPVFQERLTGPLAPDAYAIALPLAGVGVAALAFGWSALGLLALGLGLFVTAFFRNPHRVPPSRDAAAHLAHLYALRQSGHHLGPHIGEQLDIGLPRFRTRLLRTRHPVGPFERKRSALRAGQPAPCHVLPVRGMHDKFPDVVTISGRPPGRLLWSHPANRSAQVCPMPRDVVVRAVDQEQQLLVQVVVWSAASGGR